MIRLTALILSTLMCGEAGWTVQITNELQPESEPEAYIEATYSDTFRQDSTISDIVSETEEAVEAEAETDTDTEWEYLGRVQVTGYTWTGNPCANGNYPTAGYTVACNDLPLGTVVYIEGIGYRTVEDRGGMTRGTFWQDVYFDSLSECYAVTGYYDCWVVSYP